MDNVQIKHRIQVVIVLYKCNTDQSESLRSISKIKNNLTELFDLDILVYNNDNQIQIPQHPDYQIYNSPTNSMLAGAYNYALNLAIDKQIQWLLLLDQDTTLTLQYFNELHNTLTNISENIACITPIIKANKKHLSPVKYNPYFGPKWFLKPVLPGIHDDCLFAFNSGTLINVTAISSINGFPNEFPLDDLDICYFYRLYKKNYSTHVLPIEIEHQLSVLNYAQNMTPQRYQSILDYDKLMAKEIGKTAQIALTIRVIIRTVIQLFSPIKRKYALQTLKSIVK